MFNIEEELKKLPGKPGVYVMHDKDDTIIYVGKAVSLKNRVRSYFRKTNKTERIKKMVSLIDHFEYIVVDNEAEALILECNLIKKNRKFENINLALALSIIISNIRLKRKNATKNHKLGGRQYVLTPNLYKNNAS